MNTLKCVYLLFIVVCIDNSLKDEDGCLLGCSAV
jgi:hypothetical protein